MQKKGKEYLTFIRFEPDDALPQVGVTSLENGSPVATTYLDRPANADRQSVLRQKSLVSSLIKTRRITARNPRTRT